MDAILQLSRPRPRRAAARHSGRAHAADAGALHPGPLDVIRAYRGRAFARSLRDRRIDVATQQGADRPRAGADLRDHDADVRDDRARRDPSVCRRASLAVGIPGARGEPLRAFMLRQTKVHDIAVFARVAHRPAGESPARAPVTVLIPAFVVGELRSAFAIGVALYLPFVAIDLAVSAVLMGLGMVMLSPPVISLPCKLLLFVLVDGWTLVCNSLVQSFR